MSSTAPIRERLMRRLFVTDAQRRAKVIDNLKYRARRNYEAFFALLDRRDCGIALLKESSPDAARYAQDYNEAMTELRRLDASCPEFTPL